MRNNRIVRKITVIALAFVTAFVVILAGAVPVHAYTVQVGSVTADNVNVRSGPGTNYSVVGSLHVGSQVVVYDEAAGSDGYEWCKIKFNNDTTDGFIRKSFIGMGSGEASTVISTDAFETMLLQQGFPESYKPALRALHAKYPNWTFSSVKTGVDWDSAVQAECSPAKSLVENSSKSSWKSTDVGYDWSTNTWAVYDGTHWVAASREIIAYYMDPRNFLDESSIFQFLDWKYNSSVHSSSLVENMVKGTFMESRYTGAANGGTTAQTDAAASKPVTSATGPQLIGPGEDPERMGNSAQPGGSPGNSVSTAGPGGSTASSGGSSAAPGGSAGPGGSGGPSSSGSTTYVDMLMKAAAESGVNPFVLVASIIQEQGRNGTTMVSGKHSQYPGIYNFYNNNAYNDSSLGMDAVTRGLWWASGENAGKTSNNRPWNTPEKAIVEGAKIFGENYVSKGQNTFYLKRFNVADAANRYNHQYMTNVAGAAGEGKLLSGAYSNESKQAAHNFEIPIYSNMPSTPAPLPTGDGNPNNRLKNLFVEGFSMTPSFNMDTTSYDLIVSPAVTSVNVVASAIAGTSKVNGAGTVSFSGNTTVNVNVTAENGTVRTYKINIVQQNGGATYNGSLSSQGSSSGPGSAGPSGSGPSNGPAAPDGSAGTSSGGTFSRYWYQDGDTWKVANGSGSTVKNAWLCDNAVSANGNNIWYLIDGNGSMISAGLVQDETGNYYSLETSHNGFYGMLRFRSGTYDGIYLELESSHNGSFAAIRNAEAVEALKAKYGLTRLQIDNSNNLYTADFH